MNNNRCIACGAIIPEGRQVCPNCEKGSPEINDKQLVFICSPFHSDDEMQKLCNIENAKTYCRVASRQGYIPIAPHLFFPQFLNDGQPFLTKYVSAMIERLQRHGFKWENEPFDILYNRYPNCKVALQWWCNSNGKNSRFNISRNAYLKEFILSNPPTFPISPKCCQYAKKDVGKNWVVSNKADMRCMGIRRAESGIRAQKYKNCFTYKSEVACQEYRPIFFFTDETKKIFEEREHIEHSKCYSLYGLNRSGCAGCPFGSNFENELKSIEQFEPKLYKAVNNIFKDSYLYTRQYRKFKEEQK